MKTQNQILKQHFQSGKSITTLQAIKKYGITRLASRCWDLSNMGIKIKSEFISVKNRFGKIVQVKKYWI